MLYSMTGFGNARLKNDQGEVYIEIKTLNSKSFDCYMRSDNYFSAHEIEVRKYLKQELTRGKVYILVAFKPNQQPLKMPIDKTVFKNYYQEFLDLAQELGSKPPDIFSVVANMAQIYPKVENSPSEEEWNFVFEAIQLACKNCNEFRRNEGLTLENTIKTYVNAIGEMANQIEQFEAAHIAKIKRRIKNHVEHAKIKSGIDQDRLEQEIVYYLEKLDITEEKVRIQKHINYFLDTIQKGKSNGRKLEFILQELNREANTIASKVNCYDIQELVVNIKDCVAKSREQILNIL